MNTQQTTANQIHQFGWEIERIGDCCRAAQGGFKTLWRGTLEQVLDDLKRMKQAREAQKGVVPF